MPRHDLRNITFAIPVRFDSKARGRNLGLCIKYLRRHFRTNILVLEEDSTSRAGKYLPEIDMLADYEFVHSESHLFHRTRCMNVAARNTTTPILVCHDADALLPVRSVIIAAQLISSGQCQLMSPFDGTMLELPMPAVELVAQTMNVDGLDSQCELLTNNCWGMSVFFDRQTHEACGMENENFISYGGEDDERTLRFARLGFKVGRVPGPAYHLPHPRGLNSRPGHPSSFANQREFERVRDMSPDELREYIDSWPWLRQWLPPCPPVEISIRANCKG